MPAATQIRNRMIHLLAAPRRSCRSSFALLFNSAGSGEPKAEAHLISSTSRDGYPTVHRQNLTRDHARVVTSEIKRHSGDIFGLD